MVEQQLNSTSDRESDDGIVAESASVVQGELSQDECSPPKVDAKLEILHEKVTKQVIKVGHGQKPSKYSTCFCKSTDTTYYDVLNSLGYVHFSICNHEVTFFLAVHYRAWTESTQHKFEDTWHEQQPLELVLGKEKKKMNGLAIGVASMKSGERALVNVSWELGYGEEGSFSFPNVPPMANIMYEVELIGFDETKERKSRGDMTVEERIGAADRRKIEGNALFKDERPEEAMQQYEMAIAYMGDDFMFQLFGKYRDMALAVKNPCHLNMAACMIKLKRYNEAIAQCGIVLVEDENNVKALFRRGKARAELGQTEAGREDFTKARKYVPEDKAIAKELCLLAEQDKALYQKQKELYKGLFRPKPDYKPKPNNWLGLIWRWFFSLFYRLLKRERQKTA